MMVKLTATTGIQKRIFYRHGVYQLDGSVETYPDMHHVIRTEPMARRPARDLIFEHVRDRKKLVQLFHLCVSFVLRAMDMFFLVCFSIPKNVRKMPTPDCLRSFVRLLRWIRRRTPVNTHAWHGVPSFFSSLPFALVYFLLHAFDAGSGFNATNESVAASVVGGGDEQSRGRQACRG